MLNIREHYSSLPLPEEPISPISDRSSVSTLNFDYRLEKGKIFIRTRTPENPQGMHRGDRISIKHESEPLEWRLFDGTGVPYGQDMKSLLAPDEEIVEMDVASEIVVAVSNLDRVYLYKPTEKKRPICWESILGAPEVVSNNELFLPEQRLGWSFSCSVCKKEEERTVEFMHENEVVKYFKDANGVRFDFGFTPTIYVLNKSGEIVFYWDSGLPASFSRGFRVPEGTQGLEIAVAGSTIFLVARDANGKLRFFTRMLDYEINSACPGLNISYGGIPIKYPPEGPEASYFLGKGTRKSPLPGWVEHPMNEDKLANVIPKIDNRLTGQGDEARELRVLGKNAQGQWGYYWKGIAETDWNFCIAPEAEPKESAENRVLPSEKMFPGTQNLAYTCKRVYRKRASSAYMLSLTEAPTKISLELKNFHPFITDSEPFSLVLSHPEEPPQVLRFHATDAWGIHYHKKYDEELVGSVDGEPKALIATLILTEEQRALAENEKTQIGRYLKKHFFNYNEKTKAVPIIANNGMVTLKLGHERFRFERELTQKEIDLSFYMRKANDSQLTINPQSSKECALLIAKNKERLDEIKRIFSARRKEDKLARVANGGASLLRPWAEGIVKRVIKPEDPTYEQAIEDIKVLFRVHRWAEKHALREKNGALGYAQAKATLKNRISELEENLREYSEQRTLAF